MREKFELSCKVVGVVFFCFGIVAFLCAIVFFIFKQDAVQSLPESARTLYSQSQINELQNASSYILNRYLIVLMILGFIEIFLGAYLMSSNNLFVRFCYPQRNNDSNINSSGDIKLDSFEVKNQKET
jgi:hypothetical protein